MVDFQISVGAEEKALQDDLLGFSIRWVYGELFNDEKREVNETKKVTFTTKVTSTKKVTYTEIPKENEIIPK